MNEILSFLTPDRLVEIAGFLVGLAYLYFEYHANRLVWLMSVIMPALSLWTYWRVGLYADFSINVYYLIIAAYGYVAWSFGLSRKKRAPVKISRMPARSYLIALGAFVAIYALLALSLINFTNSNVPYWDAFNTSLSIVAMWMLARKYVEQWIAWLIVDAVSVGLDVYKGIYFYAGLYAIYTVIAVFGYRKWIKLMVQQDR